MAWHRCQYRQPASGADSGDRAGRRHNAGHEAPDPRLFPSGRHFAAWIGLTPKDHSTAGKTGSARSPAPEMRCAQRAGGGSDRGDPAGAARRGRASPWLLALLARKSSPKLAAIALSTRLLASPEAVGAGGELYHACRQADRIGARRRKRDRWGGRLRARHLDRCRSCKRRW